MMHHIPTWQIGTSRHLDGTLCSGDSAGPLVDEANGSALSVARGASCGADDQAIHIPLRSPFLDCVTTLAPSLGNDLPANYAACEAHFMHTWDVPSF